MAEAKRSGVREAGHLVPFVNRRLAILGQDAVDALWIDLGCPGCPHEADTFAEALRFAVADATWWSEP